MGRKTDTVIGEATLDGEHDYTALSSIETALENLKLNAEKEGREVLWDTLTLEVQHDSDIEQVSFVSDAIGRKIVATHSVVIAKASAVRKIA